MISEPSLSVYTWSIDVEYYILVYPDDLKAKVYKLKDDKYSKIGDFTKEKLTFKDINCEFDLDFELVFRKFRV